MKIRRILTENPEVEQWMLLSQYTYLPNIERYLKAHGFIMPDELLIQYISGCIRKPKHITLPQKTHLSYISPLLLYYGSTNLLAGISALVCGSRLPITNHGMGLSPLNKGDRIADISITPHAPNNGALQQFADVFSNKCDLVHGGAWKVEEILGSIPDLKTGF